MVSRAPVAAVQAGGALAAVEAPCRVRRHVAPGGVAATAAVAVTVAVAVLLPARDVEGLATAAAGGAGVGLQTGCRDAAAAAGMVRIRQGRDFEQQALSRHCAGACKLTGTCHTTHGRSQPCHAADPLPHVECVDAAPPDAVVAGGPARHNLGGATLELPGQGVPAVLVLSCRAAAAAPRRVSPTPWTPKPST